MVAVLYFMLKFTCTTVIFLVGDHVEISIFEVFLTFTCLTILIFLIYKYIVVAFI